MNQPAKAQDPSMEEILASIRRIIADDDSTKAAPKAADPMPPPPTPVPPRPAPVVQAVVPPPPDPGMRQAEIDAMLSQLNAAPPPRAAAPPPAPDVLDLTEAMAAPAPAPATFRTIDGASDITFDESGEEPPPAAAPPPARRDSSINDMLMSGATSAAVDSAFNTLAQTVLVQNARTLEDLVREMLRPLLNAG